ncbi:hypothetical protein KKF38_04560 [Patescibacteria group bacterium]|nr:hypothetical protein [Patescibacteria group bacterium]
MDFQAFLGLIRRQWLTVFLIAAATTLAATAMYFLQPPEEKLTLLFSVGVSEESVSEKSFDATKLADDFAKTVAGWLRSPTLAEKVSGISGTPVLLSASPQAKLNFLIEAKYGESSERDLVSAATKQVLIDEIEKYNARSKFKFFTTLHGESSATSRENLVEALAAAATSGILLAIGWIVLSSYFGGKVNSVQEAEKILRTRAAVIFRNPKKEEVNFLKKLVKKSKHAVLAGADVSVAKLREKLNLGIKAVELPRDAEKIGKDEIKIVVVKLDKTRVNTLRMLRAISEEKIKLVIWG